MDCSLCACQTGKCKPHLCLERQRQILGQYNCQNQRPKVTTPIADCNGRLLCPPQCSFPWSNYLKEQWIQPLDCKNSCGRKHTVSKTKNLPRYYPNMGKRSSRYSLLHCDEAGNPEWQSRSGKLGATNSTDESVCKAFQSFKMKTPPIIWVFGHAHQPAAKTRQQFCVDLASALGFAYLNFDTQILYWTDELFHNSTMEQVKKLPMQMKRLATMCVQLMGDDELHLNLAGIIELVKLIVMNTDSFKQNQDLSGIGPQGFILEGFPCSEEEAEAFEKLFYPMSLGIYFENRCWSSAKDQGPEVTLPTYFRRDMPYSETKVEALVDKYDTRSIKVLNMEDFAEYEAEYLIKIVKEKIGFPENGKLVGNNAVLKKQQKCDNPNCTCNSEEDVLKKDWRFMQALGDTSRTPQSGSSGPLVITCPVPRARPNVKQQTARDTNHASPGGDIFRGNDAIFPKPMNHQIYNEWGIPKGQDYVSPTNCDEISAQPCPSLPESIPLPKAISTDDRCGYPTSKYFDDIEIDSNNRDLILEINEWTDVEEYARESYTALTADTTNKPKFPIEKTISKEHSKSRKKTPDRNLNNIVSTDSMDSSKKKVKKGYRLFVKLLKVVVNKKSMIPFSRQKKSSKSKTHKITVQHSTSTSRPTLKSGEKISNKSKQQEKIPHTMPNSQKHIVNESKIDHDIKPLQSEPKKYKTEKKKSPNLNHDIKLKAPLSQPKEKIEKHVTPFADPVAKPSQREPKLKTKGNSPNMNKEKKTSVASTKPEVVSSRSPPPQPVNFLKTKDVTMPKKELQPPTAETKRNRSNSANSKSKPERFSISSEASGNSKLSNSTVQNVPLNEEAGRTRAKSIWGRPSFFQKDMLVLDVVDENDKPTKQFETDLPSFKKTTQTTSVSDPRSELITLPLSSTSNKKDGGTFHYYY